MLRQRLGEVDAELVRLAGLRAELVRLLAQAPARGCSATTADQWWYVEAFSREGGDGDGGVPQLRLPVR